MPSDLHHSVWLAYRGTAYGEGSANAVTIFQAAVDAVLRNSPGVDARSACTEAARMIMMPPRGAGGQRRARSFRATMPFPRLDSALQRAASAQGRR
jgi:hypothetical protein